MIVRKLRFIAAGEPGTISIHIWRDIDSTIVGYIPFSGFEFDIKPPIAINLTSQDLNRWTEIDLEELNSGFILERGMRVFIGARVAPDGIRFSCDRALDKPSSSIVEITAREASSLNKPELYAPSGDFMVRLEGTRIADDVTPRFSDVTGRVKLPRIAANTFAWADVNGDGWEDLLINGEKLFINNRGRQFRAASKNTDLTYGKRSFGLFADIDRDGDLDLFAAGKGREVSDSILINDGKGRFITLIPGLPEEKSFACAGSWLDMDLDGFVDLLVANGSTRGDMGPVNGNVLYLNRGGSRFTVQDREFGSGSKFFTSVATSGDLTGDGRPELFAGTYRLEPDMLWDLSKQSPINIADDTGVSGGPTPLGKSGYGHALGANMADLDADGDLDLVVANLIHPDWRGLEASNESFFFENRGGTVFHRKLLRELGIGFEETISDPTIADFDNDGRLDLFHNSWYHSANLYMWRNGIFHDRTVASELSATRAIASAAADFDRDGRIDLIVADKLVGMKLYRNVSPAGNWIGLRLEGTHCTRDAIGAIARIRGESGVITRSVTSGKGNGNQDSLILLFGVGKRISPVNIEISWPCGSKQTTVPLFPGKYYLIKENVHSNQ